MKHRFFNPNANFSETLVEISSKEEVHHIKKVLRLKEGAHVCVFNGTGEEGLGFIKKISPSLITIEIETHQKFQLQTPKIILACAIPKKSKFETIIEKATELGANEIIPLKTKRTEIKLSDAFIEKKLKRFNTIAINASKQSWRKTIPKIHPITEFKKAIDHLNNKSTIFIPSLQNNRINLICAFSKLKDPSAISFLIGPEGDFTDDEYTYAQSHNCIGITLGETILRVETAAFYTLSCANSYFHSPDI